MPKKRRTIFLIGEFPLVKEFGRLCHEHGVNVLCKLNSTHAVKLLPPFMRITNTIPRNVDAAFELTLLDKGIKQKNLTFLENRIQKTTIILSASVTVSVTEQSHWTKYPARLAGLSALPSLIQQPLIEIAPGVRTDRETISRVQRFFLQLDKRIAVVQDRVGMVMPRILCMLINEASFAVMDEIASPRDIDTAMKLGTNYPMGPFEWTQRIGPAYVLAVLEAIHSDLGEERYRTAPLLKQLASIQIC